MSSITSSVRCAFLLVLSLGSSALAQLPAARLTSIFPPGGKSGASFDVTISGADLDGTGEIRFTAPGITAKPLDQSDSDTDRKFTVTISGDVPAGNYEARVLGRFGITNPRGFVVGELPEITSAARNGTAPLPLPLNTVANGRCPANSVDEYTIDLKQGQRVIIDAAARELDSRLVPVMALIGPQGDEVARARRGGLIDFTASADTSYTLRLHDLLYRGGADYFYRLTASTGPHLDSIFPPSGMPGSKSKYTLLGRNLPGSTLTNFRAADGKPLEQLDVEIELPADSSASPKPDALALLGAAGAGLDAVPYRLKTDKGTSNPLLIGFAKAPLVIEQEPNDSAEESQTLSAPCEVVGRFYPHGDRDVYTFKAEKGDVYWIEIICARLNQPSSPELLVQMVGKSDKGVEQLSDVQDMGGPDMQPMGKRGGGASAAFPAPSRDIEYRLESKEAGVYRLTLRDLFDNSQDNASLVYRMVIHKQSPDFHLVATTAPLPPKDGQQAVLDPNLVPPFLRKGGASAIRVNVLRQNGFDGEVRVAAEGLPPGVRCAPAVVPANENVTSLMLLADENVAGWVGVIQIVGKAKLGDEETSRVARVGAITWPALNPGNNNAERAQSRLCGEMPLAVSGEEVEAISLDVGDAIFEAKVDGKVHIPVKIKHRLELKQPLKLAPAGLPRGNNNNKFTVTVAGDADSGALDLDMTEQRLQPGTYTFYVVAQAQIKYDRKGGSSEKAATGDGAKAQKKQPADSLVTFYSSPITLKVLAK